MCIHAHLAHVAVEIPNHSPNFLDTPCIDISYDIKVEISKQIKQNLDKV